MINVGNTSIDYIRKSKRFNFISFDNIKYSSFCATYDMEFELESGDEYSKINELVVEIDRLPSAYNNVFNMYVFEGLSHNEISSELNITISSSKSNLSRAKKLLRKNLTSPRA